MTIYGASHAVQTVSIRFWGLVGAQNPITLKSILSSHIRGMHYHAFLILWESHVIEILGNASLSHSADSSEAREIFLIAVETVMDGWLAEAEKSSSPSPVN